jgi:hypothetical protein
MKKITISTTYFWTAICAYWPGPRAAPAVTLWISSDGSDLKVHSLRVFGAKEVAPAPTAGKSRYDSCVGCRLLSSLLSFYFL